MGKTTAKLTNTLLLTSLNWVREAASNYNTQRAVSIRSNGDGTFVLKQFENAMVVKEHNLGCKAEFDSLLGQLTEQLTEPSDRPEVIA